MKKSKVQKSTTNVPQPVKDAFERVVGGDGGEFTIVCHPTESTEANVVKPKLGDALVCKVIEVKDSRPAR